MDLAQQIDQAMKEWKPKKLSQAELARLSGVPQPTISRTLKGESIPETETLLKISRVLKIAFKGLDFDVEPHHFMQKDEDRLIQDYRLLTDFNKGRLVEKADELLKSQAKSKPKGNPITKKVSKKAA